jgi:hypothetical protein
VLQSYEVVNVKDMMNQELYSMIEISQIDSCRGAQGNYLAVSGVTPNQAKFRRVQLDLQRG